MEENRGPIRVTREVKAIEIPAGTPLLLEKESEVYLTQSLGGTYTVRTNIGLLVRVDGKDADALGFEVQDVEATEEPKPSEDAPTASTPEEVEKQVWEQLRTVYDPEIPVDVVELGLIYECKVHPLSKGNFKVNVTMTLTAPGCGMGDILRQDAETKISAVANVGIADVKLVIDPPWNQSLMSDAARLQLGMM